MPENDKANKLTVLYCIKTLCTLHLEKVTVKNLKQRLSREEKIELIVLYKKVEEDREDIIRILNNSDNDFLMYSRIINMTGALDDHDIMMAHVRNSWTEVFLIGIFSYWGRCECTISKKIIAGLPHCRIREVMGDQNRG